MNWKSIFVENELLIYKQELDQWLCGRCLENIASAASTLQALAQLLGEIGNIVINDDIGREVSY